MAKEPWHLDKRVPVALIVALFMQTAGAVWWAASIQGRLDTLERDESRVEVAVAANEQAIRALETGVARQEERLSEILRLVQAIDRGLSRADQ